MTRVLGLLAMVAGLPIIVYGVAWLAGVRLDAEYRGGAAGLLSAGPGLAQACSGAGARTADLCHEFFGVQAIQLTSMVSAGVGVALLAAIAVTGYLARWNRVVLLIAFSVGLPLTNVLVVILLAVDGALAVLGLVLLESYVVGPMHPFLIAAAGLGALGGVIGLIHAACSTVKTADISVQGLGLLKDEHPALWHLIEKLAAEVHVDPPRYVIVGCNPSFFVTEVPVQCLNGRSRGRVLYLSLPLCRILRPSELASVIGHELGHFRGGDLWFSRRFYPIYQGTARSLAALSAASDSLLQSIPLTPAFAILAYFYEAFAAAEAKVSRDRELAADSFGVAAANATAAASALVKATAYDRHWEHAENLYRRTARSSKGAPYNVSATFAALVAERAGQVSLDALADSRLAHPTDSHPPLAIRLRAMGIELATMSAAIADAAPTPSAVELISDHEAIEIELSAALFEALSGRDAA